MNITEAIPNEINANSGKANELVDLFKTNAEAIQNKASVNIIVCT